MSEKYGSFSVDELTASYIEFEKIKLKRKDELHSSVVEWLHEWERFDLYNSPMYDNERRYTRLGHFIGWNAHRSK